LRELWFLLNKEYLKDKIIISGRSYISGMVYNNLLVRKIKIDKVYCLLPELKLNKELLETRGHLDELDKKYLERQADFNNKFVETICNNESIKKYNIYSMAEKENLTDYQEEIIKDISKKVKKHSKGK